MKTQTVFRFHGRNAVAVSILTSLVLGVFSQGAYAGWISRENWISRLPKEQIRRMLGVLDAPDTVAEFEAPGKPASVLAQEPGLDWRQRNGVNWVSPILNQGNCGSCVAFATVATLETQLNISSGIPGLNPSFSPQALFACGGGACEFGWMPQLAARHLIKTGVPDEACAPYTMGATGETVACSSICSDSGSRSYRISGYVEPSKGTKDIEAVKAALKKGPLVTTLMVFEDFVSYAGGVYKHSSGTSLGGHAVSLVGFDNATRSWIIRNSWGKEWGEEGFGRVSWDDTSGIGNSTWGYQLPDADGYVIMRTPKGKQWAAGTVQLEAESTFGKLSQLDIQVLDSAGKTVWSSGCTAGSCRAALDTSRLADGKYEVRATAKLSDGSIKQSQREQLYVTNQRPKSMVVSYKGGEGTDLGKPLADRVVFDLTTASGAVPMRSLEFHVRKGLEEVYTRSTDVVLPKMTMGWRTPALADGRYEIWFTGKLGPESAPDRDVVEGAHLMVEVRNQR